MTEEKAPAQSKPRKPRAKKKTTPKPRALKPKAEKPAMITRRDLSDKEKSLLAQLQIIFAQGYQIKMVTHDREKVLKLGADFIGFFREYDAVDFVCSKTGHPNRCIHAR